MKYILLILMVCFTFINVFCQIDSLEIKKDLLIGEWRCHTIYDAVPDSIDLKNYGYWQLDYIYFFTDYKNIAIQHSYTESLYSWNISYDTLTLSSLYYNGYKGTIHFINNDTFHWKYKISYSVEECNRVNQSKCIYCKKSNSFFDKKIMKEKRNF